MARVHAAHASVLFVGDPIRTIALSSIDTGWSLVAGPSCPHLTTAEKISAR